MVDLAAELLTEERRVLSDLVDDAGAVGISPACLALHDAVGKRPVAEIAVVVHTGNV